MQLQQLLDLGHWFEAFPGPPGPLYLVLLVFFVVWTVVSLYLYWFRRTVFAGNGALIGIASRYGRYAIAIGLLGLFLLVMRYLGIPYLSIRFLLDLTVLAAAGYVIFLIYYMIARYPRRLAEVRAHDLRRQYAPSRKRAKRRR